ncbi:MAG: urease accessory protein [Parasphingorhabdus sp.]
MPVFSLTKPIRYLALFFGILWTLPALAHHPLQGVSLTTFSHGLFSGIGHPIIGFDHLFFVLLAGLIAFFSRRSFFAPLGYVAAMLTGCILSLSAGTLPLVELMISLSLVFMGAIVLSGKGVKSYISAFLLVFFGLFHGAAFAVALVGNEAGASASVLAGYLLGLGLTQYLLAVFVVILARVFWHNLSSSAVQPRLAGAMVFGVGAFTILEQMEGPMITFVSRLLQA